MSDRWPLEQITIHWKAAAFRLEHLAVQVESWATRQPIASAAIFIFPFLVGGVIHAARRPLWFDEILSEYIAALPNLRAIWTVLLARTETTPPLFHVITRICGNIFGWSPLGLRLPALSGLVAMTLCVYFILRPYVGPLYAFLGALSRYLTGVAPYESVVRPYGLWLGLTALALLSWQRAAANRRRGLALAGLCLSLAAAQGVHYYAFLSFTAIGLGELARTWSRRRVDWLVWIALIVSFVPIVFFTPLIRANMALKEGYFDRATSAAALVGALREIYLPNGILQAIFVIIAVVSIIAIDRVPPKGSARPPLHEVVAWVALFLAPAFALAVGRFVTNVFVPRYSLITILGFSLLLPFVLQRVLGGSRAAALALIFVLIGGISYPLPFRRVKPTSAQLLKWLDNADPERLPLVIADPLEYLQLAHDSAGQGFTRNVLYVPDPSHALHYTGVTTPDYNLLGLSLTGRVNLADYTEFVYSHPRFLLLWYQPSHSTWIVAKLREDGASLTLRKYLGAQLLFTVQSQAGQAHASRVRAHE